MHATELASLRYSMFVELVRKNNLILIAISLPFILTYAYLYTMLRGSTSVSQSLVSIIRSRMFSTVEKGAAGTAEYRMFFKNQEGKIVSPFHDIPLLASNNGEPLFNMVVEIPRWSNAKMEIATKEPFNPIKQDVKKGKPRNVPNPFPYKGYLWNYGAIPQTWENPSHEDPNTKAMGDNDPIDVCEIGTETLRRGQVVPVKILGVMALIDEGETDWKLLVIKADDPLAKKLNDIQDIDSHLPGLIKATHDWFKIYKIPDGKPENKFAFEGQAKGAEFAKSILMETHEQWKTLLHETKVGEQPLELQNISVDKSPFKVTSEVAECHFKKQPDYKEAKPLTEDELSELSRVHYIRL